MGAGVIFSCFAAALGQLFDPRFRRVVVLGVILALALLWGAYAALLFVAEMFAPGSITIPLIGPIGGIDTLLGWGSFVLMLVLSVFLMIPVASAFSGLFLEDVAQAVEDKYYPNLPVVTSASFGSTVIGTLNFLGVLIGVNILALFLYAVAGPLIPLIFWALNGYLLGREYFTLVAARRLGIPGAKALYKQNRAKVWMAGTLMAAPLSIPLVNLVIPVLGVATFTHLYHRLTIAAQR